MDVRFINPFVLSICNTFEMMCSTTVSVDKPQIKAGKDPCTDVSGVIGFSGDAAGSVVMHFTFETASKIATAFAGTEIDPQHPDFADAIGELANMVAGGAKSKFKGLNISISLPNVIVGKDHNVSPSRNSPRIMIPCSTSLGSFQVEIGMELVKNQTGASETPAAVGVQS